MKTLISARLVRERHKQGETDIAAPLGTTIITPEARSLAAELGMRLVDETPRQQDTRQQPATASSRGARIAHQALRKAIRRQVTERLGTQQIAADVLDGLIDKVLTQEFGPAATDQDSKDKSPMSLIEQCVQWCKQHPRTVAFPDALDERALRAASTLASNGWITPVLLGNPKQLHELARRSACPIDTVRIVDPTVASDMAAYSQTLLNKMRNKGGITSLEDAARQLGDPLWFAAMMLESGAVDAVVAGNVSSTAEVLRAALRVVGPAAGVSTVSSTFFMISPDGERVLAFADCGVVPQPSTEQLADIAISTADSFRNVTQQTPRIAMLSFSTMGSVKHEAVRPARDAVQQVRQRRPELLIEGELQFDAAFCPEVAQRKVPDTVLGGQANVFVFPDLNAGNIAYKIAQRMGGYTALGPMIQGLAKPLHDLSRGCSAQDIIDVSLLAMKMSFGGENG